MFVKTIVTLLLATICYSGCRPLYDDVPTDAIKQRFINSNSFNVVIQHILQQVSVNLTVTINLEIIHVGNVKAFAGWLTYVFNFGTIIWEHVLLLYVYIILYLCWTLFNVLGDIFFNVPGLLWTRSSNFVSSSWFVISFPTSPFWGSPPSGSGYDEHTRFNPDWRRGSESEAYQHRSLQQLDQSDLAPNHVAIRAKGKIFCIKRFVCDHLMCY